VVDIYILRRQKMKFVEKKSIDEVIGKANFWAPKQLIGSCEYVGGISELDGLIEEKEYFKALPLINFKVHENGLEVSIMHVFKIHYLAIPLSSISTIELEKGGTIDVEERSVIGRAVVGGLLLGPLGAIIGGVSGLKDKVIKDKDMLLLNVAENGINHNILMTIRNGKTDDVRKFFLQNYKSVFTITTK
jgi:hypothetical protein